MYFAPQILKRSYGPDLVHTDQLQ